MNEVWDNRHLIWLGLKLTLQLSVVAIFFSSLIGLFVGPIVLALGYELFKAWLAGPVATPPPPEDQVLRR